MAILGLNNQLPEGFVLDSSEDSVNERSSIPEGFVLDAPEETTNKGFLGRVSADLSQRKENISSLLGEDQTKTEDVLQTAGQVAGGALDVGGQAFISGLRGLSAVTPDIIEEPIKDVAGDIGEAIIKSPVGKAGIRAIQKGFDAYMGFKDKFPRAARNLEATFNVGVLLAPVKGRPKISKTGVGKLGDKSREVATKITPQRAKTLTSDEVRSLASKKYLEAQNKGGVISPNAVNKFIDDIEKLEPQTFAGKLVAGRDDQVTQIISRIKELREKPINLREFQEVDEFLGEAIDGFIELGRPTKRGQKLLKIQDKLRKTIENAGPSDLVDSGGFQALKEGRRLWSRGAKIRDIERILARAELTDNPATAIKSGFRVLLSNPSRLRGYTKVEQAAMRNAAKTGIVSESLRIIGSRLVPIVSGSTGGPVAGAGTFGASIAARSARDKIEIGKAKKLFDLVLQGGKVPPKGPLTQRVAQKINSLGGASLNNFGKALQLTDDLLVKENNLNAIRQLRLDRAALLEVVDALSGPSGEGSPRRTRL